MDTATPQGSFTLDAVRHATAGRHDRIEQLLRLDEDFSLAHYVRVLRGFGGFLDGWEPRITEALQPYPALAVWHEGRRSRARLHRDLAALGAPALRRAELPAFTSPAAALGSLYVMEGSALGGQLIAARALRHLGLDEYSGAAYFTGAGPATARSWREFLQVLEVHTDPAGPGGPQAREQACGAAVQTFDQLIGIFEEVLAHEPAAT